MPKSSYLMAGRFLAGFRQTLTLNENVLHVQCQSFWIFNCLKYPNLTTDMADLRTFLPCNPELSQAQGRGGARTKRLISPHTRLSAFFVENTPVLGHGQQRKDSGAAAAVSLKMATLVKQMFGSD